MDSNRTLSADIYTINAKFLSLALCMFLLSGCVFNEATIPEGDYYYLNPHKDLSSAGRVTVVELDNRSMYPQISNEMTEAMFQAIQKKQLFGLTIIRQSDMIYKTLQMDAGPSYSLEQLVNMRKELKCNAILVGTVTAYQPYPNMSIGLELRLLDLSDGQLLWALEQVWDTTDKTTKQRIGNYYNAKISSGMAELQEELVIVSSLKFVRFVAYEIAETLQSQR